MVKVFNQPVESGNCGGAERSFQATSQVLVDWLIKSQPDF